MVARADCNGNGYTDWADIAFGTSEDINTSGIPDECESDCNSNGWPDDYDLVQNVDTDCNLNDVPDKCDITMGTSNDCNWNTVPDECDGDCNLNGLYDGCDIAAGTSSDCDGDTLPDECATAVDPYLDCDRSGRLDACEIAAGTSPDCNGNAIPDHCDIPTGTFAPLPAPPKALNANAHVDSGSDLSPRIAFADSDTWIAAWYSDDNLSDLIGADYDVLFAKSTDNGASWSDPAALNVNADNDSGQDVSPCIAADRMGTWLAAWQSDEDINGLIEEDTDILYARSTDQGATWTQPAHLNVNAPTDSGDDFAPQLVAGGSGYWIAVWESVDDIYGMIGADADILYARSQNDGLTWNHPFPLNSGAAADSGYDRQPQIATDGAGVWIAVWSSDEPTTSALGTDFDILVAYGENGGLTWTDAVPLNANAQIDVRDDKRPQLVTDRSGNWLVVWESQDELNGSIGTDADILFARSADDGKTWTYPQPLNANAGTDSGNDVAPAVATDALGNWIAVWESWDDLGGTIGSDPDILFSRSLDGGATWTYPAPLDLNAGGVWSIDYAPRLATDGAGNWLGAWRSHNHLGWTIGADADVLCTTFRTGSIPDCNMNGVPDDCEADCDGSGIPDQCELSGDMNHDGFVDGADLDAYLDCLTGPCIEEFCSPTLYLDDCCAAADGDCDGDVDLQDLWSLQQVFDRVCYVDSDCDDGLFCTGVETCVGALCEAGSYPCTDPAYSVCVEESDSCTYAPLVGMSEDFESYACGGEPEFWCDTEAENSLVQNDELFDVACLGDTHAFHTAATATNIHSHYTQLGSADWAAISYSGRLMIVDDTSGIGVTFMSQFPDAPLYYRLRRHQWAQSFHISPSAGVATPVGWLNTNVVPIPNVWYWFRIEVADTGTRTEIRAKVWRDGDPEPVGWQADCHDDSPTRLTQGTVGVWSMGAGDKYWDDLIVEDQNP